LPTTHVPVVADFVKCGQHPRDENLEAAWDVRLLVVPQLLAGVSEAARLGRHGCVGFLGVIIEDCVDNLAKPPAAKLGGPPSLFKKILDDGVVLLADALRR